MRAASAVKDFSVMFGVNNNISLINMATKFHELFLLSKVFQNFLTFKRIEYYITHFFKGQLLRNIIS